MAPFFGTAWCYGRWPSNWLHPNIAILEFFPIVLSLCLWGNKMRNHCILFFTDNKALVHVINKQSCRDKTLMVFVRKLVLVCLEHNILFKVKHILGVNNKLADCLSCFQIQMFKQLAPANMNLFPQGHTPPLAASKLANIITHLTTSSLQPSSIPTYTRAWKLFTQFHSTLFQTACFSLPIMPATLALFIAYLFERNYASSTVNTYMHRLRLIHTVMHRLRLTHITRTNCQDYLIQCECSILFKC